LAIVGRVMDLAIIFPPGEDVLALPGWRTPRLLLQANTGLLERWSASALYPAFRPAARLFRLVLRLKAVTGAGQIHRVPAGRWLLGDFLADVQCDPASIVAYCSNTAAFRKLAKHGTSAALRKLIIQVRDRSGVIIGYVKYAEPGPHTARLVHERDMLNSLPIGLGPRVLKMGALGEGVALLITPLNGQHLRLRFPPPAELISYGQSLVRPPLIDLGDHPWVRNMRSKMGTDLDCLLDQITTKRWPEAIQHGDLAPWNLRRSADGKIAAFDWEYGSLEGFPYLDLAQYVLQVAVLLYRWSPDEALARTAKWLTGSKAMNLNYPEACALTRLAAAEVYLRDRQEGIDNDDNLQRWRRNVWEMPK
jgi:hypothetical protein